MAAIAAWRSLVIASIRYASMAISWVAEENATSNANNATGVRASVGSVMAIPINPDAMPICASNIQLRRLPSIRVSIGIGTRSTTGAQNTLME